METKLTAKPLTAVPVEKVTLNISEEFLTKKELAGRLKVSVRSCENWQRNNLFPFIKVNKIVRFYWPDVLKHLQANFRVNARGLLSPRPENPKL